MWDYDEPRRDEVRATAPEVAPHRARKDRRRWCKGKPGVEHVLEWRTSKWIRYWRGAAPAERRCEWSEDFRYSRVTRERYATGTWTWRCVHEQGCATCGKIIDPYPQRRCPHFHERPQ